jgi:hypothetical protein
MKSAVASSLPRSSASARDIAPTSAAAPLKLFATLGAGWVLLIGYVFARWLSSDYFGPTPPGPDPLPSSSFWFIRILEGGMTLTTLWLIWECIVKPLRRDGAIDTDGLLVITWFTLWFHDTLLNWTVHVFSYNAHAVNFGNWTQEIPGWLSPRSNLVPEPVLALGLSYIGQCTMGAWCAMYAMQYVKERWPRSTNPQLIAVGLFTGMFLDWASEHTMISFQLMAYLSTVPSLTLFPGELYQFPLYEAFFFGGVIGFTGVVMYFKDDRGLMWAERGIDKLRIARARGMRTLLRWLAMMGLFHTVMFFFYSVPMQLFSINGGPFPKDVPSYLLNGICGEGTPYPCASPLEPIPRRSAPVPPAAEGGRRASGDEPDSHGAPTRAIR